MARFVGHTTRPLVPNGSDDMTLQFEVTHDISDITSVDMLNGVGKKTPLVVRFSTVGGEKGSADSARDPRGM